MRYYSYNRYLREKFGERVHRISLDAGFSCPNIDGTLSDTGCIYCNNSAFSHFTKEKKDIRTQIKESIRFYGQKMNVKRFIAYFQAFSSTYADIDRLKETYDIIKEFPQIVGLSISTRPDCVDEEKIAMIADYAKEYLVWMEYGLQTTHNRMLEMINRKHSYEDFLSAFTITKKYDISVGVHMIIGLPGHTRADMLGDAERIASVGVDGIKFHVLHVLKNTALEKWYQEGEVSLLTRDAYVGMVCDYVERLPKETVILRLVSTADKECLIAPDWINDRTSVMNAINEELDRRGSYQGAKCVTRNA
ncbi:MAG: TIGR01212 family radical SAM protein [Candidatus Omnitrophica bacterium]|nr:TIGR01212 family radical SAM protein [Candidatus Omnitrophota bacterium]